MKGNFMLKALQVSLCFAVFALGSVFGGSKDDPDLLKTLLDNRTITQEQYDRLKKEEAVKESKHIDVKVSTDGGLQASTYDGRFELKLGGVFSNDVAIYNEKLNPLGNGTEIRSARIEFEGTLFSDWGYEYSVDFAGGEVEIKDAFVRYKGHGNLDLKFGQYKPPFSLEQQGSRKYLIFLERALPNALVPDRKIGVGASYYGSLWTASAGIFGEGYNEDANNEGDEGWTTSGRFTFAPANSDKRVVHIGASAAYQVPSDDYQIRIRTRPESHITDTTYLNTGRIRDVDSVVTYGIESAIVCGPFSLQGEYIQASVNLKDSSDSSDFHGGYAFASWMITGESRNYRFKKGAFGRVKPDRTYGAFEVALRYSALNLNSFPAIAGGRESNITLALNWYLNRNIRVMTNYAFINNDAHASDNGDLAGNDDPGVFQARLQFDF